MTAAAAAAACLPRSLLAAKLAHGIEWHTGIRQDADGEYWLSCTVVPTVKGKRWAVYVRTCADEEEATT